MARRSETNLSIRWTRFFMSLVGFWKPDNQREERMFTALRVYTIVVVGFGTVNQVVDLYYCVGNFTAFTNNICATGPIVIIVFKISICLFRRDTLYHIITFSKDNFWNVFYDDFGEQVMKECEKRSLALVILFSCAVEGTACSYVLLPVIANIGKNGTDRTLLFGVSYTNRETPYFELTFTAQLLSTLQCSFCFFCFDIMMGILNIYGVGQFRILQHRIENLCEEFINNTIINNKSVPTYQGEFESLAEPTSHVNFIPDAYENYVQYEAEENRLESVKKAHEELKRCIKQHTTLILYVEELEYLFNVMLLGQMGISSVFLCLAGFQILVVTWHTISYSRTSDTATSETTVPSVLPVTKPLILLVSQNYGRSFLPSSGSLGGSTRKQMEYMLQLAASLSQMLLFTWSCNEIMVHSSEVGEAAYRAKWYVMPETTAGRAIRTGLMMVVMRAQKPSYLTAGKFTPITLRSFTAILSTTMSYLSLMRQMDETA